MSDTTSDRPFGLESTFELDRALLTQAAARKLADHMDVKCRCGAELAGGYAVSTINPSQLVVIGLQDNAMPIILDTPAVVIVAVCANQHVTLSMNGCVPGMDWPNAVEQE